MLLLAFTFAPAFAAGDFRLPHRAGLHGHPGFTEGGDRLFESPRDGWVCGFSTVGGKSVPWITNLTDGVSRPVGLLPGAEFEGGEVTLSWFNEGGWVHGYARSQAGPGAPRVPVPWVADGATGRTMPAGLTGPEFGPLDESRAGSSLATLTVSGFACGTSRRYSGWREQGDAVWIMNCRTGAVSRAGFYGGPEWTDSNGTQQSYWSDFSESGWFCGQSARPGAGSDAWVAGAVTGVTLPVGLPRVEGILSQSYPMRVTEDGIVTGTTHSYPGGGDTNSAVWVADAATGVTRRIGLYEGPEHTHPVTGAHYSDLAVITKNGWAAGNTRLQPVGGGYVSWVADGHTAVTRKVGLYEGEEFSPAGRAECFVSCLTESGWAGGDSSRFGPGEESPDFLGTAAWVARASGGPARRVGLTGAAHTGPSGEQVSELGGVSESGRAWGRSRDYRDAEGPFFVPWVADAASGETRFMGLTGPEFQNPAGGHSGELAENSALDVRIAEDGVVYGHSARFQRGAPAGAAAWAGDAATGAVRRIGLTGGAFTRAGDLHEETTIWDWNEEGYALGVSVRYLAGEPDLLMPWVADARAGVTRVPGLGDGVVTFTPPESLRLTESGLVYGGTRRITNGAVTAWIMDVKSGRQVTFALSVREPDGYSHSALEGVTAGGIAYGTYTLFRNNADSGPRAFLWTEGLGTLLADGPAPGAEAGGGHGYLISVTVLAGDIAVGAGKPVGAEGTGVYFGPALALATPDPGLRVTNLARLPDGKFRLSFSTDAAIKITLQSSTDLTIWKDGQAVDAPAGASSMDIEPSPPAAPNHYWRLKTAPDSP